MSFKDILAKPISEIKAPPPMPVGTYTFRIKNHEFFESGDKKTPGLRYNVAPISADEDVNKDELAALGGLEGKEMRYVFWITEDSAFRLREFLENDLGLSGASLDVLIPQATNATFKGYVNQKPTKDNSKLFSEITKTMKA